MIKVIAFDLVGVLVKEKDVYLTDMEDKLERLFGPNKSDEEYLTIAKSITDNENIVDITKGIINKLYEVREEGLIEKLKCRYKDKDIIIATNHVSYVKEYINNNFVVDDVIISADIHKIKPNNDFYEYILNKYDLKPEELLFIDDNMDNVVGAKKLGIKTIKVNKDTNIYEIIEDVLKA